uniref:Putative regulatory protein FmdB zinc ribbon domain-containing protein n=1 Tax=viral metagenome TaxID=1070528 RepID=A0A6M3JLI3_9ZZZZ
MPIYEFRCTKCGVVTEDYCRKTTVRVACPSCGAEAEKKPSSFSVRGFPNEKQNQLPKSLGGPWDYSNQERGNLREI